MNAQQPIKYPHDHCRNYLPHIENKQYQMITFRLNDSVPRHVVEQWKETLNHLIGPQVGPQVGPQIGPQVSAPAATGQQVSVPAQHSSQVGSQVSELATVKSPFRTHQQEIHRLLKLIDQYEDAGIGECLLRDDSIAQIVQDTLLFNHQKKYELICWCIMPNHVHTLIAPVEGMSLSEIMYDWKSYTTHAINKALNRKGKLWMMEYFDRFIRDNDHFQKVVNYIHNNPVKAGLVADPADWRWSSASSQLGGSQVGSQVSVPATTNQTVSTPATTTELAAIGQQASTPTTTTAPAPTNQPPSKPAESISFTPSFAGQTCEPTCEPSPNNKETASCNKSDIRH